MTLCMSGMKSGHNMEDVYVVIPHYNNWTLTHSRLWELFKLEKSNIKKVVVVDDGSTDSETEGGCRFWAEFRVRQGFDVEALVNPQNQGFIKASNLGISYVTSISNSDDIIILLSNDVRIHAPFISQIVDILSKSKKVLVGGKLYVADTGWNRFGDRIFHYLEGWLLATTSGGWKELGSFDERFCPHDYEDIDLSTKALDMGYALVSLENPFLVHMGGQSIGYSNERYNHTIANRMKFEEKWI